MVAAARGVPGRGLDIVFAALVGVTATLSLAPGLSISVFVAPISFVIFLCCWLIDRHRRPVQHARLGWPTWRRHQ